MQWIEGRLAALRTVSSYVATYPASFAARQVGWLAAALRLDPSTVTMELADAIGRADRRSPLPAPTRGGIAC